MTYSRHNPFIGHVEDRYILNKPGSTKETWHLVLNVAGSDFDFKIGDSVGVLPKNSPGLVHSVLKKLQVDPDEHFRDPRSGIEASAEDLLRKHYSLVPLSKKTFDLILEYSSHSQKEELSRLLSKDESWIRAHDLSDWLTFAQLPIIPFSQLIGTLTPLLPRLYSIASSPLVDKSRIDLTIAKVLYELEGKRRAGVCSHFLTQEVGLYSPEVGLYLQPTTHFLFPQDSMRPIILIGPGTGVAPFRAYMQERKIKGEIEGKVWLFFGERQRDYDFLYEDFWMELSSLPFFKFETAFSRDGESKVYVQHKLWEKRLELLDWLEEGASIFVCGDAKGMAKDVEATLISIYQERFGDRERALEALRTLRKEGRYRKDVY